MCIRDSNKTNSGRFINEMFCQLVGPDFTADFWKAFKDNYVTVSYTHLDVYKRQAFLTEHFGRAFELLTDIVFHSTFPQREIEKETEVILDEIQSYEDNPSELIFDDFEDLIFRGHPLGRNILGRCV